MKKQNLLFATYCLCLALAGNLTAAEFGVGSKAPAIDVEHWIQDGEGFFDPVTEFEEGNVYVVEFWATWCGPCIGSMPHLAELQTKYRGSGVQIISISDETVDEVKDLLAKENPQIGKTFQEITSAYCLTTDPDRSVHTDYMEAAGQDGIPTSFIVGKSGLVEWYGHPMAMDAPLEAIVNDSWDREAFKEELREQEVFEREMQKINVLASGGDFEAALEVVAKNKKTAKTDALKEHWESVRNGLKLTGNMVDDGVIEYYKGQLSEMKGTPQAIGQFAFSVYRAAQQGADITQLIEPTVGALNAELESAPDAMKPMLHNTAARLFDISDRIEEAIKAQESAIESADDRVKRRLSPYLEELKAKLEGDDDAEDDSDKKEAKGDE